MRKYKTRIMIILLLIAFALYFTGDFSLIDIEKTAIIVALGIDKTGDVYEVTAQVAIPQASDQSTQNDAAIIVGTGDTIFQAVDNIGIQTGWQPKLSFCDLLIFGKSVAQNDVMAIVDHVLASQKLQNSALMAISEGEAKEVLSSATALDTISSFAIQKILLKNTLHVNTVSKANVREFSMMHYSPSNCSYMPLIKIVDEPTKENQNSKSAALQVSSSSSQSGGEEKNVAFDATTTAIFSDGKLACYFNKDETLIYNLLIKDVDESFISVECEGETYLLSITKNKRKRTVSFGEKPIMNVFLDLTVDISDSDKSVKLENIVKNTLVKQQILNACENKITLILQSMAEKLAEANADIFEAKTIIYKFHNKKYDDLKDLSLKNFIFSPVVKVKSVD